MKTECRFHPPLFPPAWVAIILAGAVAQCRGALPVMAYAGACDASAVVTLNDEFFAVADDEDSIIRTYRRDHGGPPVHAVDLSGFLQLGMRKGEADIEGAARLGEIVFWISSHGRNANGKLQQSRHRLFATTASVSNGIFELRPVGRPYARLLDDLARDPRLAPFKLSTAARLAPKSPGALNIEGLCATPEGHLLIGFRNPIHAHKALVVPLLNPMDVIAARPARLGDPLLLDLGGLGIRSMTEHKDGYLILAGSFESGGVSRLFAWRGGASQPVWIESANLSPVNPEALAAFPGTRADQLLLLSDDGTVRIGCTECKKLKDPAQKQFRAVRLDLPAMSTLPPADHGNASRAPRADVAFEQARRP